MDPSNFEVRKRTEAVRVWLLGGFRVDVGARTITQDAWRLRKAAALVKLLALAPGHRLHREQAMEALWPEASGRAASNSLRSTLHAARKVLDPATDSRYLASEDESLVLSPEGDLWVDVDAFKRAVAVARRAKEPAIYRAALDLYGGDLLLEDRYEQWTEGRREELRRLYLALLIELAGLHEGHHEHESAIEVLRKATAEEPTFEEAHVALMHLHALSGQPERALAQYEHLRETLSRGLGTQPAASSRRLRDEIAAGEYPPPLLLPTDPSREGSLDSTKHNLPAPRTSFVGREREMVEIKRMLAMTRLLTLTGAGGSGKTRLALEVARDLVGVYPDGVWLLELAPLTEGALVPQVVAEVLGVHEQPNRRPTDTLVDALKTKEILLILDNCEHLLDVVGDLVALLLDSCPHLRILATSRQALGAVGEVTWTVALLSVPDLRSAPTVARLEGYEAVRLFVDRARSRAPAFALGADNAQAVAQICAHLEGLPLAIELAAARIKILPPQTLLDRLSDRLKLLIGGPRELSERQRTLRSTIQWSYELLEEGEKALFRRLSVFSGGANLEAIESVCDALGDLSVDALEGASSLLDKSLLGQEEGAEGEPRVVMLETIREYARERLEVSGEAESIKRAHAEYFLALAEEAEPKLRGSEVVEWFDRLEREHDNLRAALSWALERKEAEVALMLGGTLWWFWSARAYQSEGRRWLEEALAIDGRVSAEVRAMALAAAGGLAFEQGNLDRAQEACEEGLQLLSHEVREASEGKLLLLSCLGSVALKREEHGRAQRLYEEGLALSREVSDTWWLAYSLSNVALVTHYRGNSARATELYEESMDLFREQGSKYNLAACLNDLAMVVYSQGDLRQAAQLTEEGITLFRELGARIEVASSLCNLGWIALLQDDLGRAADLYRESLSLLWNAGLNPVVQKVLEAIACVAGARGETERAAQLWGAAQALHETKCIPRDSHFLIEADGRISAVRSGMGDEEWEEAWRKGRAMTLDEAVSYALEEEEETNPLTTPAPEELSAGQALVVLTRREEEVAALVTRGLTNRQIAAELSISEHTVATHVAKILKKLGFRSRSQLSTWVTEQRLASSDLG